MAPVEWISSIVSIASSVFNTEVWHLFASHYRPDAQEMGASQGRSLLSNSEKKIQGETQGGVLVYESVAPTIWTWVRIWK